MTERDWRIFREDFNISYKGNANTLPLRNWDEGGLPEPIRMVSEQDMAKHILDMCPAVCARTPCKRAYTVVSVSVCFACSSQVGV